ncbi:MAG TPA: RDD family protein [Caldilineaceae bacterium]|nr:RDD family protein [Caldilineaceae bacterium]
MSNSFSTAASTTLNPRLSQQAGFASRFCAFFIDLLLINGALIIAAAVTALLLRYFNYNNLFARGEEPTELASLIVRLVSAVTFLITYFVYPVFFWVIAGQTPGKRLMGLRVIRTNGQRLTVGRAIGRAFGYWISALPLFLGFIWILFDGHRQGWHDKVADTYVIYFWEDDSAR